MKTLILTGIFSLIVLLDFDCTSVLHKAEIRQSLKTAEVARGESVQQGSDWQREENLSLQDITDRNVVTDAKGKFKVHVVNFSDDPVTLVVRRPGFILINPIVASWDFYGKGAKDDYLMPGQYDVICTLGGIPQWRKIYEVTTAPQWDDQEKGYYCCVIRNILLRYDQVERSYRNGTYYRYYRRY